MRSPLSRRGQATAFHASSQYPAIAHDESVVYQQQTEDEYTALCTKEADQISKPISAQGYAAGVKVNFAHGIAATPWQATIAGAEKNNCDATITASHGRRGVSGLLIGSETQKVLTHTKMPGSSYADARWHGRGEVCNGNSRSASIRATPARSIPADPHIRTASGHHIRLSRLPTASARLYCG
jgi:hypothetical protein